jgi:CHAT domain-containing protein/tetratricopeptide (TPR) repeat protein
MLAACAVTLVALLAPRQDAGAEAALAKARAGVAALEKSDGTESLAVATALNHLAYLIGEDGRDADAIPIYERALKIREQKLGPDDLDTIQIVSNLAAALDSVGRFDEACRLCQRALRIREVKLGPDHALTGLSLNNLAFDLASLGRLEEARSLYERALRIKEKRGDPADIAIGLDNLAGVVREEGRLDEAEPLLERALQLQESASGPDDPATGIVCNNLADLQAARGDFAGAERLLRRTLAIFERSLGRDHPQTLTAVNNLAATLLGQRRFDEARPLFQRALADRERLLGPDHPDTATVLNNLGGLEAEVGRFDAALALEQRALSIREATLGPQHLSTADNLSCLVVLELDRGDRAAARDYGRRLLAGASAFARSEARFAAEADARRWFACQWRSFNIFLQTATPEELSSAALLDEVLATQGETFRLLRGRRPAAGDDALRGLVDRLQTVRAQLSDAVVKAPEGNRQEFERRVAEQRRARTDLEAQIAKATAERADLAPATCASLRAALPAGAAFVVLLEHGDYLPGAGGATPHRGRWAEDRLAAWILRADAPAPACIDLGPAHAIEAAITEYLGSIGVARGAAPAAAPGPPGAPAERLRRLVWDPLAGSLKDVTRVYLCLDGALATLPFEIVVDADGRFLVESREFVRIEEAGALVRAAARSRGAPRPAGGAGPSLLAAGAFDYDAEAPVARDVVRAAEQRGSFNPVWDPLSLSGGEADGVAARHKRAFPRASRLLLMQDAPTESRLKRELPKYDVLHLATHGYSLLDGAASIADALEAPVAAAGADTDARRFLAGDWPEALCGVVCAGANHPEPGGENGLLTGDEVGALNLSHCDLVVLSACETALGRRAAGEGLLSLTRSFRVAGARTVVSSLWNVRDDSTKELMLDFYDRLWSKRETKLDALRHAQLDLLQKSRARGGDGRPAAWGAFVLTGAAE